MARVAYSLCWELAGDRSTIRPLDPETCKTKRGSSIHWGARRPRGLAAPYLLVLRSNERTPSAGRREVARRFKKKFGHRIAKVKGSKRPRSK